MKNELLKELYDCPGYTKKLSLNSEELLNLKNEINYQWKENNPLTNAAPILVP